MTDEVARGDAERTNALVRTLWAKSTTASGEWQPLWVHLVDVGLIARALLDGWLTPPARRGLAGGLDIPYEDVAAWVAALAALHDLGKATPHFQQLSARDAERLNGLVAMPTWSVKRYRHDLLTSVLLADALEGTGIARATVSRLARLLGGHHGRYRDPTGTPVDADSIVGGTVWAEARAVLTGSLLHAFDVPVGRAPTRVADVAAVRLIGLTVVADWLASSPDVCPYVARDGESVPTLDLGGRMESSREDLCARLAELGFVRSPRPSVRRGFADLFPHLPGPRPGQQVVEALLAGLDRPGLILVEDATGSGKTEAAFLAIEHALASLGARGTYFALPTRATGDQAFRRLREFLSDVYPEPTELHLLHGTAALSADYEALRTGSTLKVAEVYDPTGDSGPETGALGGVRASAWFAQRRRGLLAPFAVGTVDQALLGGLPVKHHALRLAALADRVVVIDEVHAYDTYMSTLLERVLEWLGALGSTVLLLSATLPGQRRDALLEAYARGAEVSNATVSPVPYPRVICVAHNATTSIPIPRQARLSCAADLVPAGEGAERPLGDSALAAVADAVAAGGCVAVVLNTVGRAQAAFRQLELVVSPERRRLLHARFRFLERAAIERRVIAEFGPPGGGSRPDGAVLVATQVIEQSLDVDFDLVVSDLAPIDLLLQRRGRLHRHDRPRPVPVREPRLLVLNSERGGVPQIDRGSGFIYEPHILLRTWLALRQHGSYLVVPDDVEALIEAVYSTASAPVEQELADLWQSTESDLERALQQDDYLARSLRVPPPGADEPFFAKPAGEADEEGTDVRARTRLGESCPAVILRRDEAHLVEAPASPQATRALLERSLAFSSPRVTSVLYAQEPSERWRHDAFLHDHRLLLLDDDRRWTARGLTVCLDDELGVVVES